MDVSFYHDFVDLYLTELLSLLMSCSDDKAIKLLAPAKHKSSDWQMRFWSGAPPRDIFSANFATLGHVARVFTRAGRGRFFIKTLTADAR